MKYITVVCIFLFLGVLAWVNQERVCINSNLIGKIHIETRHGEKIIPSCEANTRPSSFIFGPLKKRIDKLNRDLSEFQVFKSAFDPALYRHSKQLRVSLQKPLQFQEEKNEITIGKDLFETKGFLKRLLARLWLENMNPRLSQNKLHLETLSIALVHVIWGDKEFYDPFSQNSWSIDKLRAWTHYLASERSLCQKTWRPLGFNGFCQLLTEQQNTQAQNFESLQGLSLWSLKPIFLQDFYKFYSRLGITDRIHFLTNWMEQISLLQQQNFTVASEGDLQKSYAQLWRPLLGAFFPQPELSLDLLVDLDESIEQSQVADLKTFSPRKSILFKAGNEVQLLESGETINLAYYKINAQKRVWVGCAEPQLLSVFFKKSKSDRLLYIKDCQSNKPLNLSLYLKGDIHLFAKKSQAQDFILFHLPSIQLARKHWHLDLEQNVAISKQRPDGFNKLKSLFGWKKSYGNRLTKMSGALPIVEWFQSSEGQYLELIDNKM